jgi:hypothetical protein
MKLASGSLAEKVKVAELSLVRMGGIPPRIK